MKKILTLSALLAAATLSFAVTAPDLPMKGWATQGGGTTGGAGYSEVTVSTTSDLAKYAKDGKKIIYVKPGVYEGPINVGSDVTIYGYQGAIIKQPTSGSAMKLSGSKNVIIRNLEFQGVGAHDDDDEDCLQVNNQSERVWIDHVSVYDGHDGNLDVTNASDYVTISWTKFSYTSKSSNHQFSNLIGNSKTKTSDRGKLRVTMHHNWWADGVKERMPRVRFGKVHVANNLFDSDDASHCVRAAIEADVRIENNVFIGVQKALDLYTSDGAITAAQMINNYEENVKKAEKGMGTAFTPPYSMGLTDVSSQAKAYALRDSIKLYAGATLPDPGSNATPTVPSSSSVKPESSSSVQTPSSSSSSVKPESSSSVVSGTASLTKHGSGSATQSVAQGAAIAEFYYTVEGATGASVTGLPEGVSGAMKGSDFYISGTVSASAAPGNYKFTVTTTEGGVTKSGTITVTAVSTPVSSSSVVPPASSSSEVPESSSSQTPIESSDSVVPESSSSVEPESSSSIEPESSSSEPELPTATLTKHGGGSSNQSVAQGAEITEFYYTIEGATGATVIGLPAGVTGTLKGMDFYISGTVASDAATGDYEFTVTTTEGGATKSGIITVTTPLPPKEDIMGPPFMSIAGIEHLPLALSVQGRMLSIQNATSQNVFIFDMQGRLIKTAQNVAQNINITLPHSGTFLVRIGNRIERVNVK